MFELERFSFIAAIAAFALFIIFEILRMIMRRRARKAGGVWEKDTLGTVFAVSGLIFITISIIARAIITGHGPFSNMYEFSLSFSWGVVAAAIYFDWRFKLATIRNWAILAAFILLLFASTLPSRPVPLVPALQQSFLLSAHVAAAIVAYGTFTIGFVSAAFYLVMSHRKTSDKSQLELIDRISYQSVVIGFPFMTLLIILGALWAHIAWGRYWGWDPKETASLVTWLLYAGYLHARLVPHWRGTRAAILLVIGFGAVLFTFFGNYIFSGLHSYI